MGILNAIASFVRMGFDKDAVIDLYNTFENRGVTDGGPGSGNFGHGGRPGQRGGSSSKGGSSGGEEDNGTTERTRSEKKSSQTSKKQENNSQQNEAPHMEMLRELMEKMKQADPEGFAAAEKEFLPEAGKKQETYASGKGPEYVEAKDRPIDKDSPSWKKGDTNGSNVFLGFASKEKEQAHFNDHNDEFGFSSLREYVRAANIFGRKPVGGDIIGGRNKDGNIVRYDTVNNVLFIGNPATGRVVTFMRPKHPDVQNGNNYAKKQIVPVDQYPDDAV